MFKTGTDERAWWQYVLTPVIFVLLMCLLTRLLLFFRFTSRYGAYKWARKQGMTDEQARAYVAARYHMQKEDYVYEAIKRAKAQKQGVEHLIKELSVPFTVHEAISDVENIFREPSHKQRTRGDALEEFLTIISQRGEIAATLGRYGYSGTAGKPKLEALYNDLSRCGVGPADSLTAIYDPNLLALTLKARAEGVDGLAFARVVFDYAQRAQRPQ
jgi:hypothetical protein